MALPVAAAYGAAKVIGGLTSSYDKETDRHRQDTNERAYLLAQAGDRNAYLFLKARAGNLGAQNVAPIAGITNGGTLSGWASAPARADARAKAQSLQARYEPTLQVVPGGAEPQTPGVVTDPAIKTIQPLGGSGAGAGMPTWLPLALAAAVVVFVVAKHHG